MKYTNKERERYNEDRQRTCERLGITENKYNWLRRKGQELHKIYEDNCNGVISTDEEYFRLTEPIEESVIEYCAKLGLKVYFQTDPRGATIYCSKEVLNQSNYNHGECIY